MRLPPGHKRERDGTLKLDKLARLVAWSEAHIEQMDYERTCKLDALLAEYERVSGLILLHLDIDATRSLIVEQFAAYAREWECDETTVIDCAERLWRAGVLRYDYAGTPSGRWYHWYARKESTNGTEGKGAEAQPDPERAEDIRAAGQVSREW